MLFAIIKSFNKMKLALKAGVTCECARLHVSESLKESKMIFKLSFFSVQQYTPPGESQPEQRKLAVNEARG